jgi:hypothetical protein
MGDVNWLSLIIAAILPSILGFAWYSPMLFGKAWMDSIGMTEEKARSGNMPLNMGISLVLSFFLAFFLLATVNGMGQEGEFDTFKHGAFHGLLLGILVVIPTFITNGLFEQRAWKTMLINVAYWIITLALMGGVIDAMNHWPNAGVS